MSRQRRESVANLRLGEAHALAAFLADADIRSALQTFVEEQYNSYAAKCVESMIGEKQNIHKARQHAHFALVYQSLLVELGIFAQQQHRLASH